MEQKTIYCGKARIYNGQYGSIISVNLCLTDIPQEHIRTIADGRQFVDLKITKLRNEDNFGNTHTVTIDQYYTKKESSPKASNSTPGAKGPKEWYEESKRSVDSFGGGPESFYDDELPF